MASRVANAFVERFGHHLSARSSPRLTVFAALVISGGVGALFSALGLRLGLLSMPVRYCLAVVVGYLAFLSCIRLWIAYERRDGRRRRFSSPSTSQPVTQSLSSNRSSRGGVDISDVVPDMDLLPGKGAGRAAASLFEGGRSGGGGGGAAWASVAPGPTGGTGGSSLADAGGSALGHVADAFDSDDFVWVVVAIAAVLGGLLAVFWVIYIAPALLAEVALNAVVVSTAYRRLRGRDPESWATAVLRRTWLAALVLAFMMTVLGWALQHLAPEAHSIGGVIRRWF